MKTSKVKSIQSVKPYNGQHGTTYYHNIELENGDKINIGKKKELQVGYEITYEIIGDLGQHEYTKAKSAQPEQNSFRSNKNDDIQKYIIRQSSLTRAIEHLSHLDHDKMTKENVTALAEYYTNWVLNG